jgi:hypothetical protein
MKKTSAGIDKITAANATMNPNKVILGLLSSACGQPKDGD